ncbi:MAG: 16S rRNA (guanine(966)-N(2))-methyltransferase RsmD [Campylobacteraceae bacterium]|jgi:16S rRNA (guanine(966)-N(2))-methyltransferase RsmD|nr:16S rRNA (guanine(966)-N(2))-methyltransferase RsmD [Campylobacteraceae bacterium]
MNKNTPLYVNIVGGKFKGKKLLLPPLESTRSTKAILKSSYFNTIQFDIVDKIFIEVFAGSGSIGLEAISRGAKKAFFIEKNRAAFDILRKNCSSLDRVNCEAVFGDAFEELTKIMQKIDEKVYLYFDPPFEIRDGMNDIYQKTFNLLKSLETKKVELATFEHMSKISMPRNIGQFQLIKTKTFGNSSITFYSLEE